MASVGAGYLLEQIMELVIKSASIELIKHDYLAVEWDDDGPAGFITISDDRYPEAERERLAIELTKKQLLQLRDSINAAVSKWSKK